VSYRHRDASWARCEECRLYGQILYNGGIISMNRWDFREIPLRQIGSPLYELVSIHKMLDEMCNYHAG
jgi:hypothetical protein